MAIIGAYAKNIGSPTPLFDATGPLYDRALADGRGAQDTAAVCAVLERMAGLKRSKSGRRKRPAGR